MKMPFRILIALAGILVIFGGIGTIKGLQIGRMVASSNAFAPPPQVVSTMPVSSAQWETTLRAVGSLEAVQGVMVAAELAGKVSRIAFQPGARVAEGALLVQQDVAEETARLRAAKSEAALARKNLERAKVLKRQDVISQSDLDEREAMFEQAMAEVDTIQAIIEKKTIRAPFAGKLGIRLVNLGGVLEAGQPLVSLQSMDPIYVNFQLPQKHIADLKLGHTVRAAAQARQSEVAQGTITALSPEVDQASRNITVQATLANTNEALRPGMYSAVTVVLPDTRPVLTIPVTAVLYAPYSDSVFVVESKASDSGESQQVLRQQFVQLGEKRGDHVVVRKGLTAGQTVVSTGVFKLRNGMAVVVNNDQAPEFQESPSPDNA